MTMTPPSVVTQVSVSLAPTIFSAVDEAVRRRVTAELNVLMNELDRASPPQVRIGAAESDVLLTVSVEGQRYPISPISIHEALAYVDGRMLDAGQPDAAHLAAHFGFSDDSPERTASDRKRFGEFLALLCRAALFVEPSARPVDRSSHTVSDVKLSLEPAYLQGLTSFERAETLFPWVREALFSELGLMIPALHFRSDPKLRRRGFAFEIAGIGSVPRVGLPLDSVLVNETQERLRLLGIEGESATNPATGQNASVVNAERTQELEAAGFTTWDGFGYFLLCFATAMRRQAGGLMTRDVANSMLALLEKALPKLCKAATKHLDIDVLTSVLQSLLWERVSIRNLRRIIELMLRYETLDGEKLGTDVLEYVRQGLADQISMNAARGTNTLVAYLLSGDLEQAVAEAHQLSRSSHRENSEGMQQADSAADRLLVAMEAEIASLPVGSSAPVILTDATYRVAIRDAIWRRLPDLTVLSYGELAPWLMVQPVARIPK